MFRWMQTIGAILLLFIGLAYSLDSNDIDPIVTTQYGQLRGRVILTERGNCHAYFAVPFAAPPTNGLRWKKPQPPFPWAGILNATELGPSCVKIRSNITEPGEESEDCLFLNIFVPEEAAQENTTVPVMVFIHGGGYSLGSAREYSEDGVCENLASRGVIVVIMQYRLHLYGFLSTGDDAALGNYGLWDQIEALKWVKKNIANFGGDPQQITLFGESAGAASVSYFTYTPIAKDLFNRSIAQSGSAFCGWGDLRDTSVQTTYKLAASAGCSSSDTDKMVECLRMLPVEQLQKLYHSIAGINFYLHLSARVDGEMFTHKDMIELSNGKPAIVGVNSMESSIPEKECIEIAPQVLEDTLTDILGQHAEPENSILRNMVKFMYIDSKGNGSDGTFVCQQISKMQADIAFITTKEQYGFHIGAAQEASSKASVGNPVWVYEFDHYTKNLFPPDYPFRKGATHAHEICYLFLLKQFASLFSPMIPGCPSEYDEEDRRIADYLGEMWANFAKTGDPSPSNMEWPQFQSLADANVMRIQTNLSIEPEFYLDVTNFWTRLIPSVESSFNVRGSASRPVVTGVHSLGSVLMFLLVIMYSY